MVLQEDIRNRIEKDFQSNAAQAIELLQERLFKTVDLQSDRIIRSVIFLSKGNLEKLKQCITSAQADPRDVMLWAEYEKQDETDDYKRMRDFSQPFERCTIEEQED